MNAEDIEKFVNKQELKAGQQIKIDFKKRESIRGLFVKGHDYSDLNSKNFWHIITSSNIEAGNQMPNINLAKIFHGAEFSRLSVVEIKAK